MNDLKIREQKFLQTAITVHGSKYDYSLVKYKNIDTKIEIICPNHGMFLRTPYKHANEKQGCPSCRADRISKTQRMSLDDFIKRAREIHNGKYDYSNVEYKNAHTKVKLACPNHGPFMITPNNHIYGVRGRGGKVGCVACSNNVSYAGQEWLDSFKNPNIEREVPQFIGNKKFKFDGLDRTTNTVYEYFGSFWHGNPEKYQPNDVNCRTGTTFGELYKSTLDKIEIIRSAGFTLVYVWGD